VEVLLLLLLLLALSLSLLEEEEAEDVAEVADMMMKEKVDVTETSVQKVKEGFLLVAWKLQ
jgi:hypothetical protein